MMVGGETRQSGQTKGPSEYGAEYERWAKNIKAWQVKPKGGAINHSACVGYEKAKENQHESEPIKRDDRAQVSNEENTAAAEPIYSNNTCEETRSRQNKRTNHMR